MDTSGGLPPTGGGLVPSSNYPRGGIGLVKGAGSQGSRKTRNFRLNVASNSVQFDTSTILENFLYLGAKGVTGDREKLANLGVGYILNVSQDPPVEYADNIQYMHVDVGDTPSDDISRYFDESCQFIERARMEGKSVLVHCTMGMSRSATLVLCYLVRHMNMSLAQALIHTKERRPVASPNPGFMQQLVNMEIMVRGRASIDVEKYSSDRFGEVSMYIVSSRPPDVSAQANPAFPRRNLHKIQDA